MKDGGMGMRIGARALKVLALISTAAFITAAQQPPAGGQAPAAPPSLFKLSSSGYAEGTMIPKQYTCADPNVSTPPLEWSNAPKAAVSFAVIFHDTDGAPMKSSMDVTHWIFWNIPGTSTQLPAGIKTDATPDGIQQGKNVRGVNGFQGPCPPPGATPHHYIFEIYALDGKLDLTAGATRADLLKAMDGHVVGKSTYVGLFGR
jgi:Raf kinase inhibitor-like YbhB/YbcL family protein